MTGMIEKVAAAMTAAADAYIKERHALIAKIEKDVTIIQHLSWADVPKNVLARAAIEALREPTELALNRGGQVEYSDGEYNQQVGEYLAEAVWLAMIDADLEEQPPENQAGVRQVKDADAMRKETQELVRLFDEATK